MNKVYLLIGGNMGNRLQNLRRAVELIHSTLGAVVAQSAIYDTAAWGKTDQQSFLNQALAIKTPFSAPALMQHILQTEEAMGRKRQEKYDPRIIDIDILFFNNAIIDTPFLTVPHPQLPNRRFALVPMNEIAPRLVHPVLQKTVQELLLHCPDKLEVRKFPLS
jgi:2-amino-4-hydroxy-6-hydroxymethyldihydropteridine diphosphokinase